MIDEEEIFALMQAAKDQQAAVERATQAMQTQRGELYGAITQLKNMQAGVSAEASRAVRDAVAGIGPDLNASLLAEVNKAKKTLRETAQELQGMTWALSWRWMFGLLLMGLAFGMAFGWMIWGRNISGRLDAIEQTVQQRQAPSAPAKAMPRTHNSKPKAQEQP